MCLPVKDRYGGKGDPAEGEGELSLSSGLQDLEVSLACSPAAVSRFPR